MKKSSAVAYVPHKHLICMQIYPFERGKRGKQLASTCSSEEGKVRHQRSVARQGGSPCCFGRARAAVGKETQRESESESERASEGEELYRLALGHNPDFVTPLDADESI